MGVTEKVKEIWSNHKKTVVIIVSVVLALCFIGSVLLAVFVGGEFSVAKDTNEVKGLLQLEEASYMTDYLAGDKFVFDKEQSHLRLIAKDPLIDNIVRVDDLPASEYGFKVEGGAICDNAEDIVLSADVKNVSVVSKYYPNLKVDIPVNVVSLDGVELKKQVLIEAEAAKLYNSGTFVTNEEKETLPEADKPYNSSFGDAQGTDCSGGACLRNLATRNMRVQFEIVCTEETDVSLVIKYCSRPDGKTFGEYYRIRLNGVTNAEISAIQTPKAAAGTYFTPVDADAVTIRLKKGINILTFESGPSVGTQNPVNLDALLFVCDKAVIGVSA